ncbi:MAG TPA: DnaJ domain-containing protein [Pyrinomonadaceae bacterium]|nr:DnaJ domain-containing protein [Pyrinomonadaceae bacterium]
MNGQLTERPLAEVIREISAKSLSGRLSVEQDRVKVAAYFYKGILVFAASNVRDLRLRGHLVKTGQFSASQLAPFPDNLSDLELAKALCQENLLTHTAAEQAQTRQISDILRFSLMMANGTWEFDERSHLNEAVNLNIDVNALLLEAERRMAAKVVEETPVKDETPVKAAPENIEDFLDRLRKAETYYDLLGVETSAPAEQLKSAYYEIARRYHPDRFHKTEPALVGRIESAFARITQAYDTLRDEGLRANYDRKLQSRKKAQQVSNATPKATASAPTAPPSASDAGTTPVEPGLSPIQRAENDFKEGFAALEQGQRSVAAGLFASAARLAPNEPRYRAYYGQMLAAQEHTRRAAEAELQAAIRLDPQNAEYRVMLAQLFRDLGFVIRARGEAERAAAADPNNRKARELLRELKGD